MTSLLPLALLILAACKDAWMHETEQSREACKRLITNSHLRDLTDLIDSQMKTSCKQSFCYVDRNKMGNAKCFLIAAYSPLLTILHKIEFKNNTPNSKKLEAIGILHGELGHCLGDFEENHCTKRFNLTAEEMLKLVYDYYSEAKSFLSKGDFSQDCSSIFQNCSGCQEEERTGSTGVATDQDSPCLAKSPNSEGGSASLLPGSEPSSSIADQLDSKKAADGTHQLCKLPDTMQTQGVAEHTTRPRVPRSTQMGSQATESMDFRTGTDMVMSLPAEEQPLAAVSEEPYPQPMNTLSLLDPAITLEQLSHQLRSIYPSVSSQHHIESPLLGSGAGSGQPWPNELPSKSSRLSGLAKSPLSKQWLQRGEIAKAVTGLVTDWDTVGTSSIPSLTLASSAGLKLVDGSRVPSGSRSITHSPHSPGDSAALNHVLDSEDPMSATRQSSRSVAATGSPSSPRQISPESGSWGEVGSRGRAPGGQQSTQVRERRAERNQGLARDREPETSMLGPGFDLSFIPPNTDRHSKKPESSDTRGMAVIYVVVPSVLGILLAVGGLLFYLHKSRFAAQRQLQRNEKNRERTEEGRPLNKGKEHVELQILEEL
ncbi:hypothetical protein JRQ81_015058 [Phrynocephalus forsythii]|uniref:Macrophage colony-stimulating factor 1 n=1 Tax=Phrynocephalus forsythii TaxID=171643 RepID=A0A9Q1B4A3_9SAUR|nr:hypothetical protein JRQ81_015058 [Phrynocephalus forsythii]